VSTPRHGHNALRIGHVKVMSCISHDICKCVPYPPLYIHMNVKVNLCSRVKTCMYRLSKYLYICVDSNFGSKNVDNACV
jgi:hypothetical protein